MNKKTTQLRELFFGNKTFVLPGVCDGYEAKIVQAAGFKACYMSGGRTSASRWLSGCRTIDDERDGR